MCPKNVRMRIKTGRARESGLPPQVGGGKVRAYARLRSSALPPTKSETRRKLTARANGEPERTTCHPGQLTTEPALRTGREG